MKSINLLMINMKLELFSLIYQKHLIKFGTMDLFIKQNGVSGELLNLIIDFLVARKQRVVLNGQYSSWAIVKAGYPQGSILGSRFFVIFINDLSVNFISNPKLFADDTSLFSVVQDITLSAKNLNDDLKKINKWAFQWKMSFNPDPNKQAQEVIFSRKLNKPNHPSLNFDNTVVIQSTNHKHLGMILDTKLDFLRHLKDKLTKISKTIGLLRKLQKILNRAPLLTIYKLFFRSHLDYGKIIYDKVYNSSFYQNLEKIQYNSALAITEAIRGTSKEKL